MGENSICLFLLLRTLELSGKYQENELTEKKKKKNKKIEKKSQRINWVQNVIS